MLYGRRELLEALDVPKLAPAPDTAPERLETGTQNHEGIVGAGAAVEFLASLAAGPDRRARLERSVRARCTSAGQALLERLWDGLGEIAGVTLFGPPPGRPRTPTVAFTVAGRTTDEVATALAAEGVFVSNGDFYATTVVERLGLSGEGLVRAGCACYTTARGGRPADRGRARVWPADAASLRPSGRCRHRRRGQRRVRGMRQREAPRRRRRPDS